MKIFIISALLVLANASICSGQCPSSPVGHWITLKLQYQKSDYGTGRNICEYDSFMSRSFKFTSLGQCPKFMCFNMVTQEVFR